MNDLAILPNIADNTLEQVIAHQNYVQLRNTLAALQSVFIPDAAAIDAVILKLAKAQFAYKATHGLTGNNPLEV